VVEACETLEAALAVLKAMERIREELGCLAGSASARKAEAEMTGSIDAILRPRAGV
jgi:hypothetical protein